MALIVSSSDRVFPVTVKETVMNTNLPPAVLILGTNGRFGRVAAEAFSDAGWQVIAQSRSAPMEPLPRNATALQCDALDTDGIFRRCAGRIDVIVNALNPVYTDWDRLVPPLAKSALELARRTGALLMLPGNVYNFGSELPEVLTEDTPQLPATPKARIRIALERQMQDAAVEGVRSVVIRAGDFLGGSGPGTWFDMVIAKDLRKNKAVYPGPFDVPHAWAYLPDLARVFVAIAARRDALQPFDVFHYSGLTLAGRELLDALERVTGRKLKRSRLPWWMLRLASPFVPMFRAVLEMRYLWWRTHRLEDAKLAGVIGAVPRTAIDEALRNSLPKELVAKDGATGEMERGTGEQAARA